MTLLEIMFFGFFSQQIDPKKRPSFVEIAQTLEEIKQRSQMAIVLADISNLNISKDAVMSKTILNKILGASYLYNTAVYTLYDALNHISGLQK